MPSSTTRMGIPYVEGADLASTIDDTAESAATIIDSKAAIYAQGTLAGRPVSSAGTPGIVGRLYYATDEGSLHYDTGTGWVQTSQQLGDMKASARANEHAGWIKSDGRSLASGVYPQLRALLIADGNPHGVDTGNPKIPDTRGRAPVGVGAGAGLTSRALGAFGGKEVHALSVAEMPAHAHNILTVTNSSDGGTGAFEVAGTGRLARAYVNTYPFWGGQIIQNSGSGGAHPTMSPFVAVQWFVYAGPAA